MPNCYVDGETSTCWYINFFIIGISARTRRDENEKQKVTERTSREEA